MPPLVRKEEAEVEGKGGERRKESEKRRRVESSRVAYFSFPFFGMIEMTVMMITLMMLQYLKLLQRSVRAGAVAVDPVLGAVWVSEFEG